jgi:hypothetical protein
MNPRMEYLQEEAATAAAASLQKQAAATMEYTQEEKYLSV